MLLIEDNDVYTLEKETFLSLQRILTFKIPKESNYKIEHYDWYMYVALQKVDKVKEDRHLLTSELILSYRWAIREGFGHQLDPNLKNRFDNPRNRNTIKGIKGYIKSIEKRQEDIEKENS